jgi:AraC-like DNA-binding protein
VTGCPIRHIEAKPTQKELASMLNVSDRTLRRRLGRQETTYRTLRDSTRFERARDLLGNSDMTMAQVAELVGYSDARAFRRAFKRWAGVLPNEFRGCLG